MSRGYRLGRAKAGYYVVLDEQPVWRRIVAAVYHRYHSWASRVPGLQLFPNLQDIRCDHLSHRGRRSLLTLDLTADQYEALGGKLR